MNRKGGINKIKAMVNGSMWAQPRLISWSNLRRAKLARIQIRNNTNGTAMEIPNYKTKNKVDIVSMLVYSPKKKKAKLTALCSVKKPATNSDSASGKSKGALLVSAIADIINRTAIGNKAKPKLILV